MASPNFDALSVSLSMTLGDGVAAAATDGVMWSSAQRTTFLNNACRRWLLRGLQRLVRAQVGAEEMLQNYIIEESATLSSAVTALASLSSNAGTAHIISVYNSTDTAFVKPLPPELRQVVLAGVNAFLSEQYWLIDGGNLRVVGTNVAGSESVTIKHVKQHVALAAGGSTDILVPPQYLNVILDLATMLGLEADPTDGNVARALRLQERTDKELSA